MPLSNAMTPRRWYVLIVVARSSSTAVEAIHLVRGFDTSAALIARRDGGKNTPRRRDNPALACRRRGGARIGARIARWRARPEGSITQAWVAFIA
eukprot:COSAG02_NODE_673_length_18630_cov_7.960768_4_plen_95_part_00